MDRTSAQDALRTAGAASAAARRRSHGGAMVYLVLGLATALIVVLLGGPLLGGGSVVVLVLALLPVAAAIVHSASRAATPRHSRVVNAVLLGLAAAVLAVTLTVGRAVFPDSYAWWIGGGALSGLAVALCGVLELRHRPTPGGTPR